MRLLTFDKAGTATVGGRRDGEIVDLSVAAPDLPGDLLGLLRGGDSALARAKAAIAAAPAEAVVDAEGLSYLPPIPNPPKIICVGLNYARHAAETKLPLPDYPVLFVRFPTTLVGHDQPMIRPLCSVQFDYEAEMVVVIGKGGRHIARERALDHVAGYSIFNEGSIRDYQFKASQWTMGKNFDATGGFGPELVTADELPPGGRGLRIQTRLNGTTLQDSDTNDLIFDIPTLIRDIAEGVTLEPGDIIVTGTPEGVGVARHPQIFMKDGDVCEVEVEGIGVLRNPIVDEAR
jgi:2-keto-4-pentenoate hydratase/2-oxohepta-3-ene-1,7-dioic acid hydratase in catechol pathway